MLAQIWRLITNFFFLGKFSMTYLFQLFMLYQYSRSLEENPFPSGGGARQGQLGDYVFMLMIVAAVLLLGGFFLGFPVLSFSMLFSAIFIYSRRFPDAPARIWFSEISTAFRIIHRKLAGNAPFHSP